MTHVGPDGLDLRNVEHEGVHESKNVERHLLGGKSPHSERFDALRNEVGGTHQPRTARPA